MTQTLKTLMCSAAIAGFAATPALAGHHSGDHMGDKAMKMKTMSTSDSFNAIDIDDDGTVTFSEFANHIEGYGYSSDEIAAEYVRLTGGGNATLTDATFAGIDARMLKHKHMDGTTHAGMSDKVMATQTMTGQTMTADFAAYDANDDGRVDFSEYSKWAKKDGMTMTQAAQVYTKMTDGQAYLDEGRFLTAMALGTDYYLSSSTYTPNTAVLNTTTVTTVPTVTTGGLLMDDTVTATTTTITPDYDTNYTGTYETGAMPKATTQPLTRPADKPLGDLTQTPSPNMQTQDYPSTLGTTTDMDSTVDMDDTDATFSDYREYEVGDETMEDGE